MGLKAWLLGFQFDAKKELYNQDGSVLSGALGLGYSIEVFDIKLIQAPSDNSAGSKSLPFSFAP